MAYLMALKTWWSYPFFILGGKEINLDWAFWKLRLEDVSKSLKLFGVNGLLFSIRLLLIFHTRIN